MLASLHFTKKLGTLAEAEIDEERYTFKRVGFLRPKITIRKYQFEDDLATFQLIGGGGGLEFVDGKRFSLERLSFWKNRWGFTNEQGDLLLTTCLRPTLVGHKGEVAIEDRGGSEPRLLLLAVLAWYVLTLMADEGEVAAASTVAVGA